MKTKTLEKLLDAVPVPVVLVDAALLIVAANAGARAAFPDLRIGQSVDKAISRKRSFLSLLHTASETTGETSSVVKLKPDSGHEYLATIKSVDLREVDTPRLLMVSFEDRSSLKDAKTMRSDFVANVSHEIRSPLTAISGFVETLQGAAKDDPEARDHFLTLMTKEVERMTHLVTDLLSLSQVEAKQRRLPKKIVDPNLIIYQAITAVIPLAEKRGKQVEYHADTLLPELPGQQNDLTRLLINLLENAINYSREGSTVQLTAAIANVGEQNPLNVPALSIAVKDEGEGIPAQDIPRLTERFYRVDKSRSRNIGGTGLGLAIVKHILVRHRGTLVIESTLGQGSTFSIYLPLGNPLVSAK